MTSAHAPNLRCAPHRAAPRDGPVDSLSTLVNLAGRQRMLSQRIVLHAVLSAQGDTLALATAQEALALFRFSHQRLLQGEHACCAEAAQAAVDTFWRLAEETLAAVAHSRADCRRLVASLVARATPVLAVLNELTLDYEMLARAQQLQLRDREAQLLGQLQQLAREAQDGLAGGAPAASLARLAARLRHIAGDAEASHDPVSH